VLGAPLHEQTKRSFIIKASKGRVENNILIRNVSLPKSSRPNVSPNLIFQNENEGGVPSFHSEPAAS
jgi:hypothetical protein